MATLIEMPTLVPASGNKPKRIEEFVGRVNSGTDAASIARMTSPAGWAEPGQTPEFQEFTLVLRGTLIVESREGRLEVRAGQAVWARAGEWGAIQHARSRGIGVHRGLCSRVLPRCRPQRSGLMAGCSRPSPQRVSKD